MVFFKKVYQAFTNKERTAFLTCSAIAIVSFIAVMSMLVAQMTVAIPTQGGTYVEGMVGQPEYVNPVTAQNETDLSLAKLIYPNIPDIADSIQSSTDGLTWTVHLKNGLTWQDGSQLTSDDVIFTVQSIQNPDADSPLMTSWEGVTVNRMSELEVQFTLANPYAFFGDDLANLYIIPKHIFADTPPGNWRLSSDNLKPVGAGPYQVTSYDEGSNGFISTYHLQAWNNYVGQQPLINNLDIDLFRNTTDLINAFNNGEIDGFGGISTNDLAGIHRPYDTFSWRTPSYYAIFFNTSKNLALQDPVVRAALASSAPRDLLVSQALDSYGVADYGPIPPDSAYFTSTAPVANASGTTSSLSIASTTLNGDGWTISSSTEFRAKIIQGTSVPLAINLTVPDIDYLVQSANILQATWQSIGIQVNIATDTTEDILTTAIKNRTYESLLFGNVLGPSSDLYSFWDSSQRFSPGLNLAIYDNPEVDSLIESARTDLNEASRTIQMAEAQTAIVNDNPAIFLYSPDYLYVTDKTVQGVSPALLVDPSDISREITNWYLNTARVLKS